MSLKELISDVKDHYHHREFPEPVLDHLEREIRKSEVGPYLNFTGSFTFLKQIDALVEKFPTCKPPTKYTIPEKVPNDVQAVFAFSFGYRLKTRPAAGEERRLPGENNRELAKSAAKLKLLVDLPLCVQFEISDALDDYTDVSADFSAPAEDMGTGTAINHFVQHMKARGKACNKVMVVAHRHHVDRCILLLKNDFCIDGILVQPAYEKYDRREAQPRVVCPEMFIVSDFISLAGRIRP